MPKRANKSPSRSPARPVLPEKLQKSLEHRRAASDQRVAKPGAESFEDIVARVHRVMERLGEVASERRVVAVSHHNFLHFFLGVTLFGDGFTPALVPGLYQAGHANTGITIFQKVTRREMDGVDLPGWVLTTWNDRAHL